MDFNVKTRKKKALSSEEPRTFCGVTKPKTNTLLLLRVDLLHIWT